APKLAAPALVQRVRPPAGTPPRGCSHSQPSCRPPAVLSPLRPGGGASLRLEGFAPLGDSYLGCRAGHPSGPRRRRPRVSWWCCCTPLACQRRTPPAAACQTPRTANRTPGPAPGATALGGTRGAQSPGAEQAGPETLLGVHPNPADGRSGPARPVGRSSVGKGGTLRVSCGGSCAATGSPGR